MFADRFTPLADFCTTMGIAPGDAGVSPPPMASGSWNPMKFLRRTLFVSLILLTLAALWLRWRNPGLLIHGLSALRWLAFAALWCLGLRLLMMAFEAGTKKLPWTRLLIPSVVLLEGIGLAWSGGVSPGWQRLRLLTAALMELALLGFAIHIWRQRLHDSKLLPEDELTPPFSNFLPPVAARLAALELVVVGDALRFLIGGYRRLDPAGHTYTKRCVLRALLVALPVLLLADLVALEFLLQNWPKLRWSVHLGDAYAVLWFTGLWASFRARPHQVSEHSVVLHHGILGRIELRRDQIVDITSPPTFKDDWARLADNRKVIQLQAPGPPLLDIQLSEPSRPVSFFGLGKPRSRVRIAVDDPEAFCRALGLTMR